MGLIDINVFFSPALRPNIRWGIPDGLNKSHQRRHSINKSHTRGDITFRGPNHVRGNPHLNPHHPGRRHRIQMSLLRGHPTCRLLATRRSLEREIPSWRLPVTFEFELEPGLEPLIAGWQYARDVRLRPRDQQGDWRAILGNISNNSGYFRSNVQIIQNSPVNQQGFWLFCTCTETYFSKEIGHSFLFYALAYLLSLNIRLNKRRRNRIGRVTEFSDLRFFE